MTDQKNWKTDSNHKKTKMLLDVFCFNLSTDQKGIIIFSEGKTAKSSFQTKDNTGTWVLAWI